MPANYEKLKALLRELFQMDQADLDFGLYRIMNAKRDEIERFLEHDLLPQVKTELARHTGLDTSAKKAELDEAIENAKKLGFDPDAAPRVMALRDELKHGTDLDALENEVFSHLCNFFRRYYHQGDFLSLRRYKEGVYAIPYEGEEVKLYWANHDQYYIKSTEYLRNYTFKLRDGRRVHFRVVDAEGDVDNNKPQTGKERRFSLVEADPVVVENGELSIRFNYLTDARKQAELNTAAVAAVLGNTGLTDWLSALAELRPTQKNPQRTLLAKHLDDFTARYAFDYFIHKDLGGFFRRELDFFIKNEIMHLDDVEDEAAPRVQLYLSKIKALRKIAHKIIAFLEQLENFQKKLWLKKKFVVSLNYCVTLDLVPEALFPAICSNDAQWQEWEGLYRLSTIPSDLAGAQSRTNSFLKEHRYLVLDTRHFDQPFVTALVASMGRLDDTIAGVCFHSENFQALNLIQGRYRGHTDCIYIDPPYNTDASPILYKNGYKSSTWCSLMRDRVAVARELLCPHGVLVAAIDDEQQRELSFVLSGVFSGNLLGTICVRSNPSGRPTQTGYAVSHEYLLITGKSSEASIGRLPATDEQMARFSEVDELGAFEWRNLRREGSDSNRSDRPAMFYPIYISGGRIRVPKMDWNEIRNEWLVQEAALPDEQVVWPVNENGDEKRWRWENKTVAESLSQLAVRKDRSGRDYVYYKRRPHEEGVVSVSSWFDAKYSATEHGTALLKALFGKSPFSYPKSIHAVKDAIYVCGASEGKTITIDFFGGSGTTGHAVINLNRSDRGSRKYVLVEMGEYFDTVLVPRLKKVVYCAEWDDGKPLRRDSGVSQVIKVLRLESYEDTLNNLQVMRSKAQQDLLTQAKDFREDYTLRYMLDVEARGSASLLNVQKFTDPFSYKLRVSTGTVGETKEVNVDLVETFNWLVGLTVKHMDHIRGVRVVEGTNPQGDRVLILWRNVAEVPNDKLDEWFKTQGYNTRDQEYDLIYVNGDNNLENLRRGDQTWKVRLIEEDFHRLMWECQDV